MSTQSSNLQYINQDAVTAVNSDGMQMTDHAQSSIHLLVVEDFFNNL
jgi:hypothetical protein